MDQGGPHHLALRPSGGSKWRLKDLSHGWTESGDADQRLDKPREDRNACQDSSYCHPVDSSTVDRSVTQESLTGRPWTKQDRPLLIGCIYYAGTHCEIQPYRLLPVRYARHTPTVRNGESV